MWNLFNNLKIKERYLYIIVNYFTVSKTLSNYHPFHHAQHTSFK